MVPELWENRELVTYQQYNVRYVKPDAYVDIDYEQIKLQLLKDGQVLEYQKPI
jgi:hypothetical protein